MQKQLEIARNVHVQSKTVPISSGSWLIGMQGPNQLSTTDGVLIAISFLKSEIKISDVCLTNFIVKFIIVFFLNLKVEQKMISKPRCFFKR